MYDNLEDAIIHKRFSPVPRPYPNTRLHEHYLVEPWEKNTLEMEVYEESSARFSKTFYQTARMKKYDRKYTTQRGFTSRHE
jgi:hypothetical protein